jgi:hypothetical protein
MDSPQTEYELTALEHRLRTERRSAPASLIEAINPMARRAGQKRGQSGGSGVQLLVACTLTLGLAGALAAVGAASYAAQTVSRAAQAVRELDQPQAKRRIQAVQTLNAGGDQYRPGYGFGDPNHNHDGPPGLATAGPGQQEKPRSSTAKDGKAVLVSATITTDEQAALYFSVLDGNGQQLLLTQEGSSIGSKVSGPQTKTIHFVMLVPRTVPLVLRIPANLLQAGERYSIRVIAVDANGNKTRTTIPFAV